MISSISSKLPTKTGYESFAILPVKITNGVVSNRKGNTYAKEKSRQAASEK